MELLLTCTTIIVAPITFLLLSSQEQIKASPHLDKKKGRIHPHYIVLNILSVLNNYYQVLDNYLSLLTFDYYQVLDNYLLVY